MYMHSDFTFARVQHLNFTPLYYTYFKPCILRRLVSLHSACGLVRRKGTKPLFNYISTEHIEKQHEHFSRRFTKMSTCASSENLHTYMCTHGQNDTFLSLSMQSIISTHSFAFTELTN